MMLSWNSPVSVVLDVIFGVLPALFLGAFAVFGLYVWFDSRFNPTTDPNMRFDSLPLLAIALGGFLACCSMLVVTMKREQAKPKWLHVLFLAGGVALVALMYASSLGRIFQNAAVDDGLSMVLYPAIVLIALKHIVMLTRGGAA